MYTFCQWAILYNPVPHDTLVICSITQPTLIIVVGYTGLEANAKHANIASQHLLQKIRCSDVYLHAFVLCVVINFRKLRRHPRLHIISYMPKNIHRAAQ